MEAEYRLSEVMQHHFDELCCTMRQSDQVECELATGRSHRQALAFSIADSVRSGTGLVGCKPVVIFGVTAIGDYIGAPWMLAAECLEDHGYAFSKMSKGVIESMAEGFKRLENYVHADNRQSIAWLRRVGFTVGRPQPYGPHDAQFCPFWMEC